MTPITKVDKGNAINAMNDNDNIGLSDCGGCNMSTRFGLLLLTIAANLQPIKINSPSIFMIGVDGKCLSLLYLYVLFIVR